MRSKALRKGKSSVKVSESVNGRLNQNSRLVFSSHSIVFNAQFLQPVIKNTTKSKQRFSIEVNQHWYILLVFRGRILDFILGYLGGINVLLNIKIFGI